MIAPVYRSISEPLRHGLSPDVLWQAEDDGLIKCWELGREMAENQPEIAVRARLGELPVLNWKGGVEHELKNPEKFGTFRYLAMWYGLRGDDLDIDPSVELEMTCSKTFVKVVYTSDSRKYCPD